MQRAAHYLTYLAVRMFICALQALHLDTCRQVAAALATFCCRVLRLRGDVVDDNLHHAFPELSAEERQRLAWRMWEHLFLLVVEIAHAPRKIHDTNWRDYVKLENARPMCQALLSRRPLVLASGHFGNFEMAGFVLGILGFPTYTVARTLDNPYLDAFLHRFRSATGQHMIPKKGGYDQIAAVLARGGHMSFLADQYAGSKGCWVTFFGRPASAHKAIALFSLGNDAPMVVGGVQRLGGPMQFLLWMESIVDPRSDSVVVSSVPKLTQWYTSELEKVIRRAPEQYWWLHRRWKDTRRARRQQRAAA